MWDLTLDGECKPKGCFKKKPPILSKGKGGGEDRLGFCNVSYCNSVPLLTYVVMLLFGFG